MSMEHVAESLIESDINQLRNPLNELSLAINLLHN